MLENIRADVNLRVDSFNVKIREADVYLFKGFTVKKIIALNISGIKNILEMR